MPSCLAIVSDLMFATKISGTAEIGGVSCAVVATIDELQATLDNHMPSTVLLDLNCDGLESAEVIRMLKTKCPDARIVAFGPHVQTDALNDARDAGADEVLPRSAFVRRLPEFLSA